MSSWLWFVLKNVPSCQIMYLYAAIYNNKNRINYFSQPCTLIDSLTSMKIWEIIEINIDRVGHPCLICPWCWATYTTCINLPWGFGTVRARRYKKITMATLKVIHMLKCRIRSATKWISEHVCDARECITRLLALVSIAYNTNVCVSHTQQKIWLRTMCTHIAWLSFDYSFSCISIECLLQQQ